MKSWDASGVSAKAYLAIGLASAWEFRGWGGLAANAPFAFRVGENLCSRARFTGYTLDGGYADYTVAHASFCFPLPEAFNDTSAAPLCARD